MQYPQIQFYHGSLVRLATGKLKQVEDLSNDDFIESAKLVNQRKSATSDQLYIDSSVVRDFLEVGPPSSSSPGSSTQSLSQQSASGSSDMLHQQPSYASSSTPSGLPTVLIKFFLESTRSIVFIEVPTEHPFFVFHRGWSSWNPQRTYDKFGLKCRKLKIGDTCISLIKKRNQTSNPSDQCNILFSSIKLEE